MNEDYQLSFCKRCRNRKFNPDKGLVCGLTDAKATFNESCPDYDLDHKVDLSPKPSIKSNSSKSWNVFAVSVLALVLVILIFNKVFQFKEEIDKSIAYNEFTDEDYKAFGNKLAHNMSNGIIHVLNEAVNYDDICKKTTSRLYEKSIGRKAICNEIPKALNFGTTFHDLIWNGGNFEMTRYYKNENDIPHIVFRAFGNESIKYVDFEVGVKYGKLVLNDGYDFVLGSTYSEYFYNTLSLNRGMNIYKNHQKVQDSQKTALLFDEINELLVSEYYEAALEVWNEIPEFFKEKNVSILLKLQIAQGLEIDVYEQVLSELLALFPDEERLGHFYSLLLYPSYGDLEATENIITQLKLSVGNDQLLDYYLGIVHYTNNNSRETLTIFKSLIEKYPGVAAFYFYAAEAAMVENDTDFLINHYAFLIKKEYYSAEQLDFFLNTK